MKNILYTPSGSIASFCKASHTEPDRFTRPLHGVMLPILSLYELILRQDEANAARAEGTIVYAVGVGPGPSQATLEAIGGDPANVFDIDEFSELDSEFRVCRAFLSFFFRGGHSRRVFYV